MYVFGCNFKLQFLLNVSMKKIVVLEHQMFLRIFNTQLCAQGIEQIHQLMQILIPLLLQRGSLDVLVLIAPHGVILFLDAVSEKIPSGCD